MSIASISGAASQVAAADASDAATVLVARKALDQTKLEGEQATKLIQSASPNRGTMVNTYA